MHFVRRDLEEDEAEKLLSVAGCQLLETTKLRETWGWITLSSSITKS